MIDSKNRIPDDQCGFRNKHFTNDQVHRITNETEKTLEEKSICISLFLEVAQTFDKVWIDGLEYKITFYLSNIVTF